MTLNQLRCLPTTSHQIEQPAAVTIGRECHGVSPQEVLHQHPPVMAGGLSFQQHDPSNTGQNYLQPTYSYGAESWHSGYSPHRYELVTLPGNVKKCYGCGSEFTDRHRSPPHNRRLVRRDERPANFLFSADYSNTYYHLDFTHIQCKNPFFNGQVFISSDKLSSLNNFQCNIIEKCNLKATVIQHFCYWTRSFDHLFQNRQEFHLKKQYFHSFIVVEVQCKVPSLKV